MIAHRLQTIESAQNLLYLESSSEVQAGEKGTPEYDLLIKKLRSTSYAHQTQEDDQNGESIDQPVERTLTKKSLIDKSTKNEAL